MAVLELLVEANLTALTSFAPNLILILACMKVWTGASDCLNMLGIVGFNPIAWESSLHYAKMS